MLVVGLGAGVAFAIRVALPYQAVLGGDAVSFLETDAWYHMRLVDALVRHFPTRIWFDPYLRHPGGEAVNVGPFFDWLIAGVALLVGGGSPSERLVDQVGAFVPPVLGALTVVPVYFLGRELFSRRAGLWAAAIVGVLPGEILRRSLLGFTDHHCAEVLLSSVALMLLVFALKAATRRERLIYATFGGVSLGCYLLTWSGGALLAAIIVCWATVQMVIERLRGRAGTDVTWTCAPAFLIAGLMVLPWAVDTRYFTYQMIAIGAGVAAVLSLQGLAIATRDMVRGRTVYLATLLALGAVAGVLTVWTARELAGSVLAEMGRFSPGRTLAIAREAQPLMLSGDRRPFPLWNQFTSSLVLAIAGLGAVVVSTSRRLSPPGVLFLVWTGAMLLATVGQVRFSYYLAVNVALAAGYACDVLLGMLSRAEHDEARKPRAATLVAIGGLAAAVVIPNVSRYPRFANFASSTEAETDALTWLRGNTPEPFGNSDLYYGPYDAKGAGQRAEPMSSAYGVLSSWDLGYHIIRIGHRVPIANPKQTGVREAAAFLLAADETTAVSVADKLAARYVIVNWQLQTRLSQDNRVNSGYLENLAGVLGQEVGRYIRVVYRNTSTGREPVILYDPAYYRTMMSRMYRTGSGEPSTETATWVVTLAEREERGSRYWELVNESRFSDYAQAHAFVQASNSPNVRLVGKDPLVSCVPLEPLRHFARVYRSLERDGPDGPSVIQIFERKTD